MEVLRFEYGVHEYEEEETSNRDSCSILSDENMDEEEEVESEKKR